MRGSAASAHAAAAAAATVSWNAAAISARARPAARSSWTSRDELRATAECPGVWPRLDLACEQLELDRRLPLVRDLAADAEQGRYRVEQPAHPEESGAFTFRLSRTTSQRSNGTGRPLSSR